MWQEINENGYWKGEVWNRKKDGELYAELLTVFTLKDDVGNIINYVGVFSDITQSKTRNDIASSFDLRVTYPSTTCISDNIYSILLVLIKHTQYLVRIFTYYDAICFTS